MTTVSLLDDNEDVRSTVSRPGSTTSVGTANGKKALSDEKLRALDTARAHAIHARRVAAKHRLEQRLDDLRRQCAGLSDDHLARVAAALVHKEEVLREKQNTLTESLNRHLQALYQLMHSVKERVDAIERHQQRGQHGSHSGARL